MPVGGGSTNNVNQKSDRKQEKRAPATSTVYTSRTVAVLPVRLPVFLFVFGRFFEAI